MLKQYTKTTGKVGFALFFALFFTACSDGMLEGQEESNSNATAQDANMHPYDVNKHALNKVVCDPMGGGSNGGSQSGLKAELFYLDSSQPDYNRVGDYFQHGTKSTQELFFTDLYVPTRMFDTGFPSQTGEMIKDDQNNELIEYFALKFRSVLKLNPTDLEGDYELALLSDDGTIMRFTDIDGEQQVVVNNDGDHPTKMGCGEVVHFDHDTTVDVEIDYYQGPRHHISLIPLWRKVDANTRAEKECGKLGNHRFFDPNNNSKEKQTYLDMLLRGWQPIHASNWHLPIQEIYNPCVEGTNPRISDFSVQDIGEGVAIVTWTTDIPATSQVLVKRADGSEFVTTSDNVLRTSHRVVIDSEIDFGETYIFQGISISADMGKTLSRVIQETF